MIKLQVKKTKRDRTLIKLLKSPGSMVLLLVILRLTKNKSSSKTFFLSSDPIQLCDRLKLILQEKQAGNHFDIFNEEIVVIVDKFLE